LLLAFGIAAMVALWGYAKVGHGGLLLSQMLIVPLLLTYAAAVGKWQRGGNPQTFYFRGVEQNAIAVCCGGLCAFAATTPIVFADSVLGAATFSILVAGVTGAVVFLPAFGLAIESAVPRRRSAEELYRS
ncbi:MAG TPA: hypothetical protein VH000_11630, partial [Rhizomicrobium sp.]|nr:hypothetical protein [Rhizomicrobium sp.]